MVGDLSSLNQELSTPCLNSIGYENKQRPDRYSVIVFVPLMLLSIDDLILFDKCHLHQGGKKDVQLT